MKDILKSIIIIFAMFLFIITLAKLYTNSIINYQNNQNHTQ